MFSNATPLIPSSRQPSSNDNVHINSPTSFKMLLFWTFLISCLFFCLQSWKGHMITKGKFCLNGLQNSLGLKMFLPLMGCFTMSNKRCAPQLIRSLACLLPNEILWWNMRARRRHKRICWSSMSRRVSDTTRTKLVNTRKFRPCFLLEHLLFYNRSIKATTLK